VVNGYVGEAYRVSYHFDIKFRNHFDVGVFQAQREETGASHKDVRQSPELRSSRTPSTYSLSGEYDERRYLQRDSRLDVIR